MMPVLASNTTVDRSEWETVNAEMQKLPHALFNCRGFIGLSIILTTVGDTDWYKIGGKVIVPNNDVNWVTLTDVVRDDKTARWLVNRKAEMRFGAPVIGPGDVGSGWDISLPSFTQSNIENHSTLHVLSPNRFPQLFRVANRLSAVLNTAAGVRCGRKNNYIIGDNVEVKYPPKTYSWIPKAYLGFSSSDFDYMFDMIINVHNEIPGYIKIGFLNAIRQRMEYRAQFNGVLHSIYERRSPEGSILEATLHGDNGERRIVRFGGQTGRFVIKPGQRFSLDDVIAFDQPPVLPHDWFKLPFHLKWGFVASWLRNVRSDVVRVWFERQAVQLTRGLTHWPMTLCGGLALTHSKENSLAWDISGCVDYFVDAVDAIICPPVELTSLYGSFPGDVAYDVRPYWL